MFASGTGNMRGPRVKTPLLLLLLLLPLLLTTLTGTETLPTVSNVSSALDPSPTEEDSEGSNILLNESGHGELPTPINTTDLHSNSEKETTNEGDNGLSPIIILIPVVLVVVIISMIVCGIFIHRRCNQKVRDQELGKEDPYLDGSSIEKVPMPMFEEDVPSVLELEMEELGQWMKKDGKPAEDSKLA
ncbi:transmembrane protein 154 isoform X4 [Perca flavescens]|uniref:transmembrane protein 154 isoform X4 n=1 Tax=Perca flavescens TaxID=8167 RepID=UPI00106E4758|nr:transmembrane protein 154 isoform X4 [Perca flavescens]